MKYLRNKIHGAMTTTDEHRLGWAWRRCLSLVSRVYGGGIALRAHFFQAGIFQAKKLPCKVVSVGNLTIGGTGKTPMAIYMAGVLKGLGCRVAVISRGYRGRKEDSGGIVSDGRTVRMSPREAGDEPYLMAMKLDGVPVLVGKDRFRAGMLAMRAFAPEIVVLDDGFQHLRLHRDVDVLLLDAVHPFGNGRLFPAGVLREPAGQLKRSDAIVLTRSHEVGMHSRDKQRFDCLSRSKPVFRCNHVPDKWIGCEKLPYAALGSYPDAYHPDMLKGRRVYAFSGIAGNEHFQAMVKKQGCEVVDHWYFPDHHDYSDRELAAIFDKAGQRRVDYVVTTEKDYVRMAHRVSWPVGLLALGIRISFGGDTERFHDYLRERLLGGKLANRSPGG